MNIEKGLSILLILISLNIVKVYAQQDISSSLPVVSLDFETECLQALSENQIEFDSVADGITGKAAML